MSFIYQHVNAVRVIDGDTVELEIDVGNHMTWRGKFRLAGIDAPEKGKPGHAAARKFLWDSIKNGFSSVETFKPDKFGRWLADLYVGGAKINDAMIAAGHAVPYFGGAR